MTGASVSIRRATLDDLPAVVALCHALTLEDAEGDPFINRSRPVTEREQEFRRIIRPKPEHEEWEWCWVAVVGDDVVGYVDGGWKESASWRPVKAIEVRSIFVKEPLRGRGIGRRLMLEVLRWSEERQAQAVELGVFFSNTRAIAFYHSLGFAPTLMTMERALRTQE